MGENQGSRTQIRKSLADRLRTWARRESDERFAIKIMDFVSKMMSFTLKMTKVKGIGDCSSRERPIVEWHISSNIEGLRKDESDGSDDRNGLY